jgi:hypothetical protein
MRHILFDMAAFRRLIFSPSVTFRRRTRRHTSRNAGSQALAADKARTHAALANAHKARNNLLEDALDQRIDQMRIAPNERGAQVVFVKDGQPHDIAELDRQTFEELRDDMLFKKADDNGQLHARRGDQDFTLNASNQNDELVLDIHAA